jgi:1,4-dihydroxy-2-naphthoate octaprenyltransferase
MNAELQAAVQAALGYALPYFMERFKKWFNITDPFAKGLSVAVIIVGVSLFMNSVSGLGLSWQVLLQNMGAMFMTTVISNAKIKSDKEKRGV